MSTKRKYLPGERIESLDELVKQDLVYIFGKHSRGIRCIGVVESMTLKTVMAFLKRGIYKAVPYTDSIRQIESKIAKRYESIPHITIPEFDECIQHVSYDSDQLGRNK